MHGARAALQGIVTEQPGADLALFVIWMPMVDTDSEDAAKHAATLFAADARVRQFYDPERRLGLALRAELFSHCLEDSLSVLPDDHPLRPHVQAWSEGPPQALWDAALFYSAGATWNELAPAPVGWAKQVGFIGERGPGEKTGLFFRNDCKSLPVETDWLDEIHLGLAQILPAATAAHATRIQLLSFPGCPNTPIMRTSLEEAIRSVGWAATIEEVNVESLPPSDVRCGYGVPTVLVNGSDLLGAPAPTSTMLNCRAFPDGVPPAAVLAARLKELRP